jgi:hypothetical protein
VLSGFTVCENPVKPLYTEEERRKYALSPGKNRIA